ncbi:MAG TPA: ABC transporter permease [Spirochaetia bacterium]|nr:ABC transporter permease [Spirochaetia bacterium]
MRLLVRPIIIKELRHIVRDPRTLAILLILPLFLLIMFGYAINLDVKHIGLVVVDQDHGARSRQFLEGFSVIEYFDVVAHVPTVDDAEPYILREEAQAVIVIPPDFSRALLRNETVPVQVIVDGSNPTVGQTAIGYVEVIAAEYQADLTVRAVTRAGGGARRMEVDILPRIWFNPELRSAVFLVPGLVSFILMVTAVISTSLSIVREKEHGTIEQLAISPVRSYELLIGKTVPYFFLSLINAAAVLAASYLFFDISIKGSYLVFFWVTLVFLAGCLGLGILISTLVDTQQNAFMVTVFLTVLPSYILSGFIFPIRNMPILIQGFSYLVPNRYFLAALRSIMIRGVGIESFLPEFLSLLAFDAVVILIAVLRLRKLKRL